MIMAKLEHYEFNEFLPHPHPGDEDFVYLLDDTGQWGFEVVHLEVFDDSSEKSARLVGKAVLSGKEFTGMMSLAAGDGKLTLRRSESDET